MMRTLMAKGKLMLRLKYKRYRANSKYCLLIGILLVASGCSKDDDLRIDDTLVAIQLSDSKVYELDKSGAILSETNIDSRVADTPSALRKLDFDSDYISFVTYEFAPEQKLTIWQHNFESGVTVNEDIYKSPLIDGELREQYNQFTSNQDYVAVIIDEVLNGEIKEVIGIINIETSKVTKVSIANQLIRRNRSQRLVLSEEYLFYYEHIDLSSQAVHKIDLQSGQLIDTYHLNETNVVFVTEDFIYEFYNEGDGQYNMIDIDDFQIVSQGSFPFGYVAATPGFYSTDFSNDQMVVFVTFAQPSPITGAPAIWDFSKSELEETNLNSFFSLFREINSELLTVDETSAFTQYRDFDLASRSILLSYRIVDFDGNLVDGGFLTTTFDAKVRNTTSLGFEPEILYVK